MIFSIKIIFRDFHFSFFVWLPSLKDKKNNNNVIIIVIINIILEKSLEVLDSVQ